MGALGHYLEREGIPTAQISLIREQTATIKPPRALWVPFMLGRPFGAPNEPDFQRKVLRQLLSLFEHAAGPVLEDCPEEAPAAAEQESGFACPVRFAAPKVVGSALVQSLSGEIAQLKPWYELAQKRRGRTTVGIYGGTIDDALSHVALYLDAKPVPAPAAGVSVGMAVKRACDDIKAYYYEAVAAQPGNLAPKAIERWFWSETVAAQALLAIRDICLASEDPTLKPLGKLSLIPRAVSGLQKQ